MTAWSRCATRGCGAAPVFEVTFKAKAAGTALVCADCAVLYDRHVEARRSIVVRDDTGKVRESHPDTAKAAAKQVRTGTQRSRALAALAAAGDRGLTDYELAKAIGHPRPHVAGTRRKELQDLGLVEATDLRRSTDTGSPAIVFRVTGDGADEARRLASATAA